MKSIGVFKHIDQAGRLKIPRELLAPYNLKAHSLIRFYQKEKSIIIESVSPNCIFCDSQNNIHKYEDKYICSNCIKGLKNIMKN